MPDSFDFTTLLEKVGGIVFTALLALYANRYLKLWEGRKKEQTDTAVRAQTHKEAADDEILQLRRDFNGLKSAHESVKAKVDALADQQHQVDIKLSTIQATYAAAKETLVRIEDQLGRLIDKFMPPRK